jgi:hypothetical protein
VLPRSFITVYVFLPTASTIGMVTIRRHQLQSLLIFLNHCKVTRTNSAMHRHCYFLKLTPSISKRFKQKLYILTTRIFYVMCRIRTWLGHFWENRQRSIQLHIR